MGRKPATPTPLNATTPSVRARRADGWRNLFTSLGVKGRDKRLESEFSAPTLSILDCEELWRSDDMAARIIETVPKEMLREKFTVSIKMDAPESEGADLEEDADAEAPPPRADYATEVFPPEEVEEAEEDAKGQAEAVMDFLDELDVCSAFIEAMQYERAYGGSAILMGANDGKAKLGLPLNLDRVTSLDWLTVLSPRELKVAKWYSDPTKGNYGRPELFELQPEPVPKNAAPPAQLIHESRLIVFPGVRVTRRKTNHNGFGDSVLQRVVDILRDYGTTWESVGVLMSHFAQAVYKIKGLAELVANNEDNVVVDRARLIDLCRSILRGILIDSEEEFQIQATPLVGVPDVLQQFSLRLAAAARMPVTLLMGQAPAGLNATGESDIRWFYDSIASERERLLRPKLNRLLEVLFHAKNGPTGGVEPESWSIEFKPLWQLTELQQVDLRVKQAQADKLYIDAGVLMPEEVAKSRFGGDAYSTETVLDKDVRASFEEQEEANAEAEAAAEAERIKAMAKGGIAPAPQVPPK